MIDSKDDLLEEIRKLSASWQTRSARRATAALMRAWPLLPVMTSADWAHLLDALKAASVEGAEEITGTEKATLNEAILLLEALVYRC